MNLSRRSFLTRVFAPAIILTPGLLMPVKRLLGLKAREPLVYEVPIETFVQYGNLLARTGAFAEAEMLAYAQAVIVLGKFGEPRPMPPARGNIRFRRPTPLVIT